jgi:hypothetical protein
MQDFSNEQQEQRAVRVLLREKIISRLKIRTKRERFPYRGGLCPVVE